MRTETIPASDFVFDLIVVGGGITGAGCARDAALRGLCCLLIEKNDFASGVTSKSTRLIHGGLRYLANGELGLVAESLTERAILRNQVPYLVHPMPILIPIYQGDPHGRAVISLGIHLYDVLSHEKDIPHYFTSNKEKTLSFEPRLNPNGLKGSALFYDHQIMMPERLVIENIVSAREHGAQILNHMNVEKIDETPQGIIIVSAKDMLSGQRHEFRSKVLINAGGPWIDIVRDRATINQDKIIFPSKGVHLVLPRISNQPLFVSSRDGRMFFIMPLGDYSLIGTTDTAYAGNLDDVHADAEEVDYLLDESRRVLPQLNLRKESILFTYAGIRPLAFSGERESKISRKHRVIKEGRQKRIITIAGGKLTTYRKMAKDAVDAACETLNAHLKCVTDKTPLPGTLPMQMEDYLKEVMPSLVSQYRIAPETVRHLIHYYGNRASKVVELTIEQPALAARISPETNDIYAQVLYSVIEEGAKTLSDIVLRRMHLGITATRGTHQAADIAKIAATILKWNKDEREHFIQAFKNELEKDTACLQL